MTSFRKSAITALRHVLRSAVPLLRLVPFTASRKEPAGVFLPRRILLLHPGHLGDLVISTSILDPLQKHFPNATVSFVVGSWAVPALAGVLGVDRVHTLDHWRLNRGVPGLVNKWRHYWNSRAACIREIRERRYDLAISLLDVNPDLLDVAWSARIPVRVGWSSSYFAPLATRLVENADNLLQHQAMRQAGTLSAIGVRPEELQTLASRVAGDTPASLAEVRAVLQVASLHGVRYRVIHMGAGAPMKQMPHAFWRCIAEALSPDHTLLFTGRGAAETQAVQEVSAGLPNCVNACNRLSWGGFVSAIRAAEVLYGVDSMAGHVAAAVGTPVISAYQGAGGVARWRPLGGQTTVFTRHLPCAPCLLPNGCDAMTCKDIDPEALLSIPPRATSGIDLAVASVSSSRLEYAAAL